MAKRILRFQVHEVPVENPITSPASLISDPDFDELYDWQGMTDNSRNVVLIIVVYWATPKPVESPAT